MIYFPTKDIFVNIMKMEFALNQNRTVQNEYYYLTNAYIFLNTKQNQYDIFEDVPNKLVRLLFMDLPYIDIKHIPLILCEAMNELTPDAPTDTAYKRWSCHSGRRLLCKLCRTFPPPTMGARFTVIWASQPCGPTGWLAMLYTKASDVETNPGPTTLNKRGRICDICYKQIHVRKMIII